MKEAKADAGKARLTLVPRRILWAIAAVRQYGVEVKYPETGVDGWRTIGKERIRDAMYRHLLRYLDDPDGVALKSPDSDNVVDAVGTGKGVDEALKDMIDNLKRKAGF